MEEWLLKNNMNFSFFQFKDQRLDLKIKKLFIKDAL